MYLVIMMKYLNPEEIELIRENITKIISNKLKDKEITQVEFARICNVSRATVQKWCKGTCPTADKLPIICKALNINEYDLLGTKNPFEFSLDDVKRIDKINANPSLKDVVDKY